ncbi:hypothetical protein [Acinetobacter sp. ANC 4640]
MPMDAIQQILHIQRKKNQQVMRNVARLWDIGQKAQTPDELLDALHPWGEDRDLRFYNVLPMFLVIASVLVLFFGGLLHHYFPFFFSLLISAALGFWAYLIHESQDPINEVIQYLRERMLSLRYDLHFHQLPDNFTNPSRTLSVMSVMSQLKALFPMFSKGTEVNRLDYFASTTWLHDGQRYPVIIFEYDYIIEVATTNQRGERNVIRKINKRQWGAFIFDAPALGLAISNTGNDFFPPYIQEWETSDIQTNRKLDIYGCDAHETAKHITPSFTLKLYDFFEKFTGDLLFHPREGIVCYLGEQDLFRLQSKQVEIQEISHLRGHLRTLGMLEYDLFKEHMLKLLS